MSAKIRLRNGAARFLFSAGITVPGRCARGRLSIVTFHRVLPEAELHAYPYPGLVVTPQELDGYLAYFTEHFDCGPLSTQHERYLSGGNSARPLLALTFDDAPHDNYQNARPVLARHRVKATFFAPVVAVQRQELLWHDRLGFAILALFRRGQDGQDRLRRVFSYAGLSSKDSRSFVVDAVRESKELSQEARLRLIDALEEATAAAKGPDFARPMTFDELAELATDGHEIGSHSMTHRMMPACDDGALAYEVSESRRILRSRLAQPVESFCYPNGDCDARTADAVAKAGYRRAVTTKWGYTGQRADRFQLCRYDMDAVRVQDSSGNFLPAALAFRMSGLYPGLA